MNTDILETLYKTFTGKAPEAIRNPFPGLAPTAAISV